MAFKSEAQRKKFAEMVKSGEISKATYQEWDKASPKKLPERVKQKEKPQKVKIKYV